MNAIISQYSSDSNGEDMATEAWLASYLRRAAMYGPIAEIAAITPAMAKLLLSRNDNNRRLHMPGVRKWAEALRRGEWKLNGEPVVIADTGELNDGQHRLSAVVETGISLKTFVVFGVARASRNTMGGGIKRSPGQILGMEGIANGVALAAALRMLINIREFTGNLNLERSVPTLKALLDKEPDISLSLHLATPVAKQFKVSGAAFVALHYMMAMKDRETADRFFELLGNGAVGDDDPRHPITMLRERLIKNLASKAKLGKADVVALTIKAWNAYRAGETIRSLRWRTEGGAVEAFPQVQ